MEEQGLVTCSAQFGVLPDPQGSATGKLSHTEKGLVGFGAALEVLCKAHGSPDGLKFWFVSEASPNELGCTFSCHLPSAKGGNFAPKGWDQLIKQCL